MEILFKSRENATPQTGSRPPGRRSGEMLVKEPARVSVTDVLAAGTTPAGSRDDVRGVNDGGREPLTTTGERPLVLGPQFALRLGDGAVLMAVEGHTEGFDLSGREVWVCFVLTAEEAALVRATLGHAEHAAASFIATKLPRKPVP